MQKLYNLPRAAQFSTEAPTGEKFQAGMIHGYK